MNSLEFRPSRIATTRSTAREIRLSWVTMMTVTP